MQSRSTPPFNYSTYLGLIFLSSFIYWIYLSLTTKMIISCDAGNYQALGQMLNTQGWKAYFISGPNREPIYPLIVALAMHLGQITGIEYTKIMAFIGVLILAASQVMIYQILRLLKVRPGIMALILGYFAVSPAINNSAFSLFSEIVTLPIILAIILWSFYAWQALVDNHRLRIIISGIILGLLLTIATLSKATFELIGPLYLISITAMGFAKTKNKISSLILLLTSLIFVLGPVNCYKWSNLYYNGHFTVTNRGSSLLYGNMAERQEPLSLMHFVAGLTYVPGEGVCKSFFDSQTCTSWSFEEADKLRSDHYAVLKAQQIPETKIDSLFIKETLNGILNNPLQYIAITMVDTLRIFFWESTAVGFVEYPHWLVTIYHSKIIDYALRLILSLSSILAVFWIWVQCFKSFENPLVIFIGLLLLLFILSLAFFSILSRYCLPIAPLYLIAIGFWLNQKLHLKK